MKILIILEICFAHVFFAGISASLSWADSNTHADTLGLQRTAVILLNTSGQSSHNLPKPSEIEQAVFTGEFSANNYYKEISYGQIEFSGEVYGWFDLPELKSECALTKEKLFQVLNLKMNLKQYDRFIVFYSIDKATCESKGLGESTHGKETFDTPQGQIRASVSNIDINFRLARPMLPYQPLTGLTSGVLAHEIGHGLGIFAHSNILNCGTKTFSDKMEDCQQSGIADMFAIMGGEGFFRPSVSLNACHKEDLGWLQSPAMRVISIADLKNNPQELDLYPIEKKIADKTIAIRVDLEKVIPVTENVSISRIYLEYKAPQGMDRRLTELRDNFTNLYQNFKFVSGLSPVPQKIAIDGVQIRGGFMLYDHCYTTYLFDTRPGSIRWNDNRYDLYDSLDGFLNPNMKVSEPRNHLAIENLSKNIDGSMRVRLSVTQ